MTHSTVTALALTWGLAYFVLLFAVILGVTLWPSRRARFRDAARIPLRDDRPEHRP